MSLSSTKSILRFPVSTSLMNDWLRPSLRDTCT